MYTYQDDHNSTWDAKLAEPGQTDLIHTIDSPSVNTTWPATPQTRAGAEPSAKNTLTKPGKTQVEVEPAWTQANLDLGEPKNIWPGLGERHLKRVQIWANKLSRIMEQSVAESKCACIGLGEPTDKQKNSPATRLTWQNLA